MNRHLELTAHRLDMRHGLVRFIAHLAETLPAVEMLRQAQLDRPRDIETRHPFCRAAFTITGRSH